MATDGKLAQIQGQAAADVHTVQEILFGAALMIYLQRILLLPQNGIRQRTEPSHQLKFQRGIIKKSGSCARRAKMLTIPISETR